MFLGLKLLASQHSIFIIPSAIICSVLCNPVTAGQKPV